MPRLLLVALIFTILRKSWDFKKRKSKKKGGPYGPPFFVPPSLSLQLMVGKSQLLDNLLAK